MLGKWVEHMEDNTHALRQAAPVDANGFIGCTLDAAGQSVVFAISYRPARTVHTENWEDTEGNIFK